MRTMKQLIFAIFLLLCTKIVNGQWYKTNCPSEKILNIAVDGNYIFVGTRDKGVFLSNDNGNHWEAFSNGLGLEPPTLANLTSKCLAINGTDIYLGTGGFGVFKYSNYTNTESRWVRIDDGSLTGIESLVIQPNSSNGINIFAGTRNGVLLTTNGGGAWVQVNNGLPPQTFVHSLILKGSNIFAGTDKGVFLYDNVGSQWVSKNNGITNWNSGNVNPPVTGTVLSLSANQSLIFAGTYSGVFFSNDNAESWTHVGNAFSTTTSLIMNGATLFAGAESAGVYSSSNNGSTWNPINDGFNGNPPIYSLAINRSNIFAGAEGAESGGVWTRRLCEFTTNGCPPNPEPNTGPVTPPSLPDTSILRAGNCCPPNTVLIICKPLSIQFGNPNCCPSGSALVCLGPLKLTLSIILIFGSILIWFYLRRKKS